MRGNQVFENRQTITVAGGVGSGTFIATGELGTIYIAPGQASTYDWTITNKNAIPRKGLTGQTGATLVDCGGVTCLGTNTITFSNATNGTYAVSVDGILGLAGESLGL